MKKTNNTTIRKNKFLRLSASGILLAMLFVFVFAGALSASFAVEKIAIEKGQLEENVAEAAGTWENGVDSFNNGFTTYNVWDKVDFGTVGGATDSRNRTLSASGDLSTFIGYDIVKCRLQHRVTDDSSGYTFTFYVKKNNSSGTTMINQSHTLNSKTTYTSDWYTSSFPTTLYFYCSSGGKLTNWSTVLDVLIEFAAKSYTITVNEQSPTTAGSPSSININGGSTLGSITRAYKTGYTLQGYYTGTNGSGTKIFNANGTVNKGTTYVDSSGRWIKNENPTVYAYWVKNTGTIIYDKNAPTGKTVTGTVSNTTVSYNTAFSLANGGYTCAGYAIIGWETDSANYTLGQSFAASATSSAPFKLTDDGQTFSITMRAVWHEIGFTFNGTNYATYNNEVLKILVDLTGSAYISEYNVPSGFTCEILYDGSSSPATTLGAHSATVTIKEGNTVRGTRTLSFTITEGDFAKKTSGVSGNWGSATNPYVIKTNEHLTNLINITNGTQAPQNSVKGVSGIAANAAVQGEYVVVDGVNVYNYANCVFELDPTETLTATGIIGKDATWAFKATFDGKNNSIALTISHTGSNYTGLFGYLNGAVIQNLKVSGSISGAAYTGGIAGYATGGSITNCQTLSSPITSVVGTGRYVAGIVGNANACNITSCTNNATITGARDTAGIVGYTAGTMTISGCTNNGNVTSSATSGSYDETGGIGGEVDNGTTITNCTNTGIIIGKICQNGGIAGWMAGQFTGTITNSGPVLGGSQVGGIAGKWIMNANCSSKFIFG